MRFSLILALLPLFAACNSTNTDTTSSSEKLSNEQAFEVIALKHASAMEMANTIDELLQHSPRCQIRVRKTQQAGSSSLKPQSVKIRVLADQRTNSLLVTANSQDMLQIRELVAALDVELK